MAWVEHREVVEHDPVWVPAMLRVDAEGNTRPGYRCAHMRENGTGQCESNVFDPADSIGRHSCVLPAAARWVP